MMSDFKDSKHPVGFDPAPISEPLPGTDPPIRDDGFSPSVERAPPPDLVQRPIKARGRVIETREGHIVMRSGIGTAEETFECPENHGIEPGNLVTVYEDGDIEVEGREPAEQVIAVPNKPPASDDDLTF